jgi:hypothetical protein
MVDVLSVAFVCESAGFEIVSGFVSGLSLFDLDGGFLVLLDVDWVVSA